MTGLSDHTTYYLEGNKLKQVVGDNKSDIPQEHATVYVTSVPSKITGKSLIRVKVFIKDGEIKDFKSEHYNYIPKLLREAIEEYIHRQLIIKSYNNNVKHIQRKKKRVRKKCNRKRKY